MYLKEITNSLWSFVTPCSKDGTSELHQELSRVGQRYFDDAAGLLAKIDKAAQQPQGPRIFNTHICHQIDGNIYQITHGSLRMLFFYSESKRKVIVCATCFVKTSQKTPAQKINSAKAVEKMYVEAEKRGEVIMLADEEE